MQPIIIETLPLAGEVVHVAEGDTDRVYSRFGATEWRRQTPADWERVEDPAALEIAYQAHRRLYDAGVPYRGTHVPFGYRYASHRLIPVAQQQMAITQAIATRLMGWPLKKIAGALTKAGYPTDASAAYRLTLGAMPAPASDAPSSTAAPSESAGK